MGGERARTVGGQRPEARGTNGETLLSPFRFRLRPLPSRLSGGPLMGFLNGRVTYVRYRVGGARPLPFGEEHLDRVQQHAIGRHGAAEPADGIVSGWAGG